MQKYYRKIANQMKKAKFGDVFKKLSENQFS